jgi:hypothetical protein
MNSKDYSINQEQVQNSSSEFGTRVLELEEKQRIIKDRLLLIGNNLVSLKDEYEKEIIELKNQIKELDIELKKIKQLNKRILEELSGLARKRELEILERQMKIFSPLELVKSKDIKEIIRKELEEYEKEKNKKNKDN